MLIELGSLMELGGAFFSTHPYLILLLVLTLEEGGLPLPLPGDGLILLAGAAAATGHIDPLLAGLCVVVAATVGSSGLYLLGRHGGRPLLLRLGHWLHLDPRRLARMERWLAARPAAIVWSRLVPGLRIVTSFTAGALRLPLPVYLCATVLSSALWAALYLTLGALLGPAVPGLLGRLAEMGDVWLLALLLALLLLVGLHRARRRLA